VTDEWISDETEQKERDFAGILAMHTRICKSILSRHGGPPYLYIDCHAGPGTLEYHGRSFPGSPLIFRDAAERIDLAYEAIHFEQNKDVAARLNEALKYSSPVIVDTCERGLPRWLATCKPPKNSFGLVYADPIGKEIPAGLLATVAAAQPKTDILAYVSATAYKRRNGVRPGATLAGHIAQVKAGGKSTVLIRKPLGRQQWTFVLWSNWDNFPEWAKRGFYRLTSETGQSIVNHMNYTHAELQERMNTPLPFDDDPPYRTYREYLKHPRFLKVRAQVFERAGGMCERCHRRPPTEPHHLRYPPWGTFDLPENMIAVCHECHCEIHGKAA
jgi:hypothetical protein